MQNQAVVTVLLVTCLVLVLNTHQSASQFCSKEPTPECGGDHTHAHPHEHTHDHTHDHTHEHTHEHTHDHEHTTHDSHHTTVWKDVVNLDAYPLTNPDSAEYAKIVSKCTRMLDENGAFVLSDFLTPTAVQTLLSEVLAPTPTESEKNHTVFQLPPDPSLPPTHPRNRMVFARIGFVGRSLLSPTSLLTQLYNWDPLANFLSAIAATPLYRSTDDEGSVYAIVNSKSHITTWHFDQSPFSIVFMLQPSDIGGDFQWVPHLRTQKSEEEMYDTIDDVLNNRAILHSVNPPAGSVFFFHGSDSLHQSSMVHGDLSRITAILTFADREDFRNSDLVRQQNWKV